VVYFSGVVVGGEEVEVIEDVEGVTRDRLKGSGTFFTWATLRSSIFPSLYSMTSFPCLSVTS